MSFNWADYFTLAVTISKNPSGLGPKEAALRSAVSRAYYAAFCASRNLVRDRGEFKPTRTGKDHRLVKEHFRKSPAKNRQQIAAWLDRLHIDRNEVDYEDMITNPEALARFSVINARKVLDALRFL
jgi:uncharacterized protein (UPF0332 family)